jgi:hypothetical protein
LQLLDVNLTVNSFDFFLKLLLMMFVIVAALAAPAHPEIPATSLQQKNLAYDVEDRSLIFVNQILQFGTLANAGLVFLQWLAILCLLVLHSTDVAINPHKCSFVRRS